MESVTNLAQTEGRTIVTMVKKEDYRACRNLVATVLDATTEVEPRVEAPSSEDEEGLFKILGCLPLIPFLLKIFKTRFVFGLMFL